MVWAAQAGVAGRNSPHNLLPDAMYVDAQGPRVTSLLVRTSHPDGRRHLVARQLREGSFCLFRRRWNRGRSEV
jgi:hypothetical protein